MLSPEQISRLAALTNAVIDVPLLDEAMEQSVFEHAVILILAEIERVLPPIFSELINDASRGIDRDGAKSFSVRLAGAIAPAINLPYLSEEEEFRMIESIVTPIVRAMVNGRNLESVLNI